MPGGNGLSNTVFSIVCYIDYYDGNTCLPPHPLPKDIRCHPYQGYHLGVAADEWGCGLEAKPANELYKDSLRDVRYTPSSRPGTIRTEEPEFKYPVRRERLRDQLKIENFSDLNMKPRFTIGKVLKLRKILRISASITKMKVVCVFLAMLVVIALGSEKPKLGMIEDNISYVMRGKDSKKPPKGSSGANIQGKNSWKSIETPPVLDVSKEEKSSFEYGLSQLLEKDKIEEDMAAKNMRVSHNSSTYIHQSLFRSPNPRSIAAARTGFMIDCATKFVMDRWPRTSSVIRTWFRPPARPSATTGPPTAYVITWTTLLWGSTFRPFRRVAPPDYGDGVSSLRLAQDGQPLPSARLVSSAVNNIRPNRESSLLSVLHMTYGQFFDHDLTFAPLNKGKYGEAIPCCLEGSSILHPECAPISIPADDPFYSKFDQTCMDFVRSAPAERCLFGPREQINEKTAYIDGSQVYGSDDEMMNSLRKGEDGLLIAQISKEGEELLPADTDLANECNQEEQASIDQFCFRAGDMRVNEQVLLTLFHTVWVRHHNHLASRLKSINPSWDDEKLFQETRRIVVAQLQHVTYNEYLPPIFGNEIIEDFKLKPLKNKQRKVFYRPDTSAAISAEFATAALRFGHSMIADNIERVDKLGITSSAELSSVFMNPFVVYMKNAIPQLTRGVVRQSAGHVDPFFTPQVAGLLFKGENMFGLDLVALNLQRGRDHGIASYTAVRNSCELSPIRDFDDLSGKMDDDVIAKLRDVYRHVDDIDLFIGGMAEHPMEGGVVGPAFACILLDQVIRLKEGDRYWYETNDKDTRFTAKQVEQIRSTTLAGVMCEVIPELKEIQAEPLKLASSQNPILPCSSFQELDLKHWKE
ncbi:peroxidase-like [Penaeus indicus]|uniref:peroxidase-like n=1 Tax=Penaeus indicus TaxID=29960 RepID=UPI00300C6E97